jgi:hypothetical protein
MAQHSAKGAQFQAVTGNRLVDGEVVYFTSSGAWAEAFDAAAIAEGGEAADALLAQASPADIEAHVLDPYLFEVIAQDDGSYLPASVRETIRAKGPTIRPDLGKQAAQESA